MTAKRFTTNGYKIYDSFHDGMHWLVNEVEAEEIIIIMNNLDTKARERSKALSKLQKENEQLKSTMKEVAELLEEEVDLFSDEATIHDVKAYIELRELDNKDAYYIATSTKKAIKMLKGDLDD